jgi:hypothetical protein
MRCGHSSGPALVPPPRQALRPWCGIGTAGQRESARSPCAPRTDPSLASEHVKRPKDCVPRQPCSQRLQGLFTLRVCGTRACCRSPPLRTARVCVLPVAWPCSPAAGVRLHAVRVPGRARLQVLRDLGLHGPPHQLRHGEATCLRPRFGLVHVGGDEGRRGVAGGGGRRTRTPARAIAMPAARLLVLQLVPSKCPAVHSPCRREAAGGGGGGKGHRWLPSVLRELSESGAPDPMRSSPPPPRPSPALLCTQDMHPLPFDENYNPKPAVGQMLAVLQGQAVRWRV